MAAVTTGGTGEYSCYGDDTKLQTCRCSWRMVILADWECCCVCRSPASGASGSHSRRFRWAQLQVAIDLSWGGAVLCARHQLID